MAPPGFVPPQGGVFSVIAFTVTNGRIAQINVLLDPERLKQLDLSSPFRPYAR